MGLRWDFRGTTTLVDFHRDASMGKGARDELRATPLRRNGEATKTAPAVWR